MEEMPILFLLTKKRDSTAVLMCSVVHLSPLHKNNRLLKLLKAIGTHCIEISGAIRKSLTNIQASPRAQSTVH